MTHRENVEIRTKYSSVMQCMNNCRDIERERIKPINGSKKIYGVVNDDKTFKLSGGGKITTIFEFKGHIETRKDGIYMVGKIRPKRSYEIFLYTLAVLFSIGGVFFLAIGEMFTIFYGLFLISVGWVYVIILSKYDGLYRNLINKLK